MASNNISCCDSKKQKMSNHNHAHHSNGHSHSNGNSHNGHMNGFNGAVTNGVSKHESEVAVPEMCFFCFEVLHCELNNIEGPPEPNFTNDS